MLDHILLSEKDAEKCKIWPFHFAVTDGDEQSEKFTKEYKSQKIVKILQMCEMMYTKPSFHLCLIN